MKRLMFTVYATVILGCFFGKAQVIRNASGLTPTNPILTNPANITQFEVSGRLITQNAFLGLGGIPAADRTGEFGNTARWNSMGSLPSGTQLLNGFRAQTDGRGLAWGHLVKNGGSVSNPFIEWIGNNGAGVTPGNLDFKYAFSPTGAEAARVSAFTIEPRGLSTDLPNAGANAYTNKGFIGQLQSGAFGSFGVGDTWSATGQITTPSFTTFGARQQFEGYTLINGLIKGNQNNTPTAVQDFGGNTNISIIYKFRGFTNATDPTTVKNIWQSSNRFNNIVLGRQDYSAVNSSPFYLSLFDGVASNASSSVLGLVSKAGIYATTDTKDELANFVENYASVVGDISAYGTAPSTGTSFRAGILGIGTSSNVIIANPENWAGYFLGGLGVTGGIFTPSDKKFKKDINIEKDILTKLMQLQPKNYLFDIENNKKMAFSNQLQHGLISQEVELVFPELVKDVVGPGAYNEKEQKANPSIYKAINYMGFIPMLIKAVQELKLENDALRTQINSSKTLVINDRLNLPAEIENKAFSLSQNVPNPFSEKTTISYSIPTNVTKAVLAVFDLNGRMLLQYNLQQGKNQLTINGNSFPAGMYIYSLIADGQEVVSKRMILTK